MDSSLTQFELTESTMKGNSDSGSDKSENWTYGDTDSSNDKSDEDFDNKLPETVTLLKHDATGAKVYLVGTAHFSKESQHDVELVIQNVKPNVVVVELCESRTNILTLDEETVLQEAKSIDMQKMIATLKTNGVYNGLMYLLLLNMSAYITKEIGMAPGGEFRVAYKEAKKLKNCGILLGDRPINITLKRALARLTWIQTFKLAWHLLNSKDPISVEEIEKCKNRDMLEQLLAELAGEYPTFREVFLNERDIYLTHSLQAAAQSKLEPKSKKGESSPTPIKIVGVVGIGHVPGIVKLWPQDQKPHLKEILQIPPPSLTSKVVKFTFRATFYGLSGYLVYRYVPVPRFIRDNTQLVFHKIITSVQTTGSNFKFVTHHSV